MAHGISMVGPGLSWFIQSSTRALRFTARPRCPKMTQCCRRACPCGGCDAHWRWRCCPWYLGPKSRCKLGSGRAPGSWLRRELLVILACCAFTWFYQINVLWLAIVRRSPTPVRTGRAKNEMIGLCLSWLLDRQFPIIPARGLNCWAGLGSLFLLKSRAVWL